MKKLMTLLISMGVYAVFMKKKLSKIEIYASTFFALFFGKTVDEVLDLQKNYYGYFRKGADPRGVMTQLLLFPTINLLFLNHFPFKKRLEKKTLYIMGWSVFSLVFETVTRTTPIFYYKKWKWWMSACLYPLIFTALAFNLKFIRKLINVSVFKKQKDNALIE